MVVRSIAALAPYLRAVITTNLDGFLGRAFPEDWEQFDQLTGDLAQRRRYILRLHGAVHLPDSWVLTESDFDRRIANDAQRDAYLSATFCARKLLFIGVGMKDPVIERHLQRIRAISNGQPSQHYLLVRETDFDGAQVRAFRESGLTVVTYREHDDLPMFLDSLSPDSPIGKTVSLTKGRSPAVLDALGALADVYVQAIENADDGGPSRTLYVGGERGMLYISAGRLDVAKLSDAVPIPQQLERAVSLLANEGVGKPFGVYGTTPPPSRPWGNSRVMFSDEDDSLMLELQRHLRARRR